MRTSWSSIHHPPWPRLWEPWPERTSSDGADLTFEFTQPKYNVDAGVLYALYASDSQDFGKQEKLAATIGGTTVTVKQSALNSVILNLGGEPGAGSTVYLRLDSIASEQQRTWLWSPRWPVPACCPPHSFLTAS